MAEVKAKVPRKKASKRQKKDWSLYFNCTGHNWFVGVLYLAVHPELLV